MKFKDLTKVYGMSVKSISERFGIPYRTAQNWNSEQRECPDYVLRMIDEILENESKEKIQNK